MDIKLMIMDANDIPLFKKEIQEAFQKGFEEVYGPTEGIILPEVDIDQSLNTDGAIAYKALIDNEVVGGAVVVINKERGKYMLTSKQRAYLRSLATNESAIMQIGKGGISDNLQKTVSDALEARELIKLSVLENCEYTPRESAEELASAVGADVVGVIGRKVILYRESKEHKKIELK